MSAVKSRPRFVHVVRVVALIVSTVITSCTVTVICLF
jgi:hypothetical protein